MTISEVSDTWVDAAAFDRLSTTEFLVVHVRGVEIGLLRTPDGSAVAVRNLCPHRLAPICRGAVSGTLLPNADRRMEWGYEGLIVRCPWHQWEFDVRTGEPMFGVTRSRLKTYETRVEGGRVHVRTEER